MIPKMLQKNILEASPEEIRVFAINFLGLDIESDESDDAIFAKVQAAHPSETIFIPVNEEGDLLDQTGSPPPFVKGATETTDGQRMQGGLGRSDPKFKVIINNEERNGVVYDRPKEVGVNGTVWMLQRGVEIDIPARVFEAMEVAVRDVVTHDPKTHQEHHQAVKSVPYNVLERPSRADMEAYRARVSAEFCPA